MSTAYIKAVTDAARRARSMREETGYYYWGYRNGFTGRNEYAEPLTDESVSNEDWRDGLADGAAARKETIAEAEVVDLTDIDHTDPRHPEYEEPVAEDNTAKKFDAGKAPVWQGVLNQFPLALQQIANVSLYGKTKYGSYDGWKRVEDGKNRYRDAKGRHLLLQASEGPYDVGDSGLPHLAQEAWNAVAVLELALRDGELQLTTGNDIVDGQPVLGSNGRTNEE